MRRLARLTNLRLRQRGLRMAVIATGLLAGAAGVSYAASVLTSSGAATSIIQACQNRVNGDLRVVADNSTECRTNEMAISWNERGVAGAAGAAGAVGAAGPTGPTGPQGATGANGAPCLSTDPACKGAKGDTGATGPAGPAGSNGTNGTNGTNGANGAPCPSTDPACKGAKGDQGDPGTNGTNGTNGATGPQGPVGPPGLSPTYLADLPGVSLVGTKILANTIVPAGNWVILARVNVYNATNGGNEQMVKAGCVLRAGTPGDNFLDFSVGGHGTPASPVKNLDSSEVTVPGNGDESVSLEAAVLSSEVTVSATMEIALVCSDTSFPDIPAGFSMSASSRIIATQVGDLH